MGIFLHYLYNYIQRDFEKNQRFCIAFQFYIRLLGRQHNNSISNP